MNELEEWLDLKEVKDRVIMYGWNDDTYKSTNLYKDIKEKIKEIKNETELLERIDKAIEYIEKNSTDYGEGEWKYRTINADNVIKILKGSDKE